MSTELLPMRSFGAFGDREPEFDMKMASSVTSLYSPQDCWGTYSGSNESRPLGADHMHFQPLTASSSGSQPQFTNSTASSGFNALSSYTTPPMFTAANAMSQPEAATISPLQTHFVPNQPSPNSYNGSAYDDPEMQMSTNYPGTSTKQRKDSFSPAVKTSNGGRRRKSESVEVGSARAIYLEKNRKAASKCRNKQKRQQEELVEEAREVERRNKLLKAEVEILKGGMRELFDIVAQHSECPDSRLKLYLQRKADRLAAEGLHNLSYTHQYSDVPPASHGMLSPGGNSPSRPH